jgi:rhodanese-related sulfurtransferase
MNIPRNFLEVEAYEKLADKDAAIIIVSSKGIRGGLAANTLTAMGYTNVRNLLGGVEGWTK